MRDQGNNAAQGYKALTTKSIRSIIPLAMSLIIARKNKFITSFQRLKLALEGCHPLRQTSRSILTLLPLIFFTACSKPVYKVEVQEVLVPIKCNLALPKKPKDNGSFKSHKDLAKYYLEVEQIAKECTNGESK